MCFCLAFVQAFSVFPSAVLLGSPAGPTRVISIAAYEAAFEQYDYSLASAIAMIIRLRAAHHRCRGARPAQHVLSRAGERRQGMTTSPATGLWFDRVWRGLLLGTMTLFLVNVALMIAAVVTSSFASRWLGTWLPEGWTTTWYTAAWRNSSSGRCSSSPSRSCSRSCSWRSHRRAGSLHAGAPQFRRQAFADAAVSAAADGAADHVRHSAPPSFTRRSSPARSTVSSLPI